MPPLSSQPRRYSQNATAAPSGPQVSGITRHASVCTPRSTHCLLVSINFTALLTWTKTFTWRLWTHYGQQECIPVGCVPPACWLYPSMHCEGGCVFQHALGRAMCIPACTGQGCVYPSMQWGRHPPLWTDRHLWKNNLHKLHLRTAIIGKQVWRGCECETFNGLL